MKCKITKRYNFEAAHFLPYVCAGHPCGRVHGHSYQVIIELAGEVDPMMGWLVDYGELNKILGPMIERLDHNLLNDLLEKRFHNPTAENIAAWFLETLERDAKIGAFVSAVTVKETEKTSATVSRA